MYIHNVILIYYVPINIYFLEFFFCYFNNISEVHFDTKLQDSSIEAIKDGESFILKTHFKYFL